MRNSQIQVPMHVEKAFIETDYLFKECNMEMLGRPAIRLFQPANGLRMIKMLARKT